MLKDIWKKVFEEFALLEFVLKFWTLRIFFVTELIIFHVAKETN